MTQKYFLKLDGVQGESQSPRHIGEIEISSFNWGHPEGAGVGGGFGAGKASFNNLVVTKLADKTSPFLRLASAEGRHIKHGALTIEKISKSGGLLHSLIINFKSILINFVTYSGNSPDFSEQPLETVELTFASKEWVRS